MTRGRQKFNDMVTNPLIDAELAYPVKKGRSKKLVESRDTLLLTRYWFYGNYTQLRYEVILDTLSKEFFIAPARIVDIIQEDTNQVFTLRKEKPTIKQLAALWPFLVWKV